MDCLPILLTFSTAETTAHMLSSPQEVFHQHARLIKVLGHWQSYHLFASS